MVKLTIRRKGQERCPTCYLPAESGHLQYGVCRLALQRARSMRRLLLPA